MTTIQPPAQLRCHVCGEPITKAGELCMGCQGVMGRHEAAQTEKASLLLGLNEYLARPPRRSPKRPRKMMNPVDDSPDLRLLRRYGALHLPQTWWAVIQLRLETILSPAEIADRLGITVDRASHLWRQSLQKGPARIQRRRSELGLPCSGEA